MNAIQSIQSQTIKSHIEIIVVNDCSSEKEYYTFDWEKNNIKIIHLEKNTRDFFGFVCVGHVRNIGISVATGRYIAFCDDDDSWLPNKLELQLDAMERTGCKMSSTEGLFGRGAFDALQSYPKYNAEAHLDILKDIYKNKNSTYLDNGFPEIWTNDFIKIHNCVLCSSVVIEKEILDMIHNMRCVSICSLMPEDYDCWLRATQHTDCVYVKEPCIYYDGGHGYGLNR
jgi:glycosyltransferase involved in cell wall biosynthesis